MHCSDGSAMQQGEGRSHTYCTSPYHTSDHSLSHRPPLLCLAMGGLRERKERWKTKKKKKKKKRERERERSRERVTNKG